MNQIMKFNTLATNFSEKLIAGGCEDGTLQILSVNEIDSKITTEIFQKLQGHTSQITKVLFASKDEIIVSGDFAGTLILWKKLPNKHTYALAFQKQIINGPIYDFGIRNSENKIKIFCGCDDGLLKTVEIDLSTFEFNDSDEKIHEYGITNVCCNKDCIVTAGLDNLIILQKNEEKTQLDSHKNGFNCIAIAPSNSFDKNIFAAGSEDGILSIFDCKNEKVSVQKIELGEPILGLDWSRGGFSLAVSINSEKVRGFQIQENGEFEEVEIENF